MGIILTKEIRNTIESNGPNKLYMVQNFAHLNNDGLVTRALSLKEKEGVLIRLSQGIFISVKKQVRNPATIFRRNSIRRCGKR